MWKRRSPKSESDSPSERTVDWRAALQKHDRWLRTIVYSRLGEPQAVDEVMQEVALAAVRAPQPPTEAEKVAPWLYRVAVRQVLMYRRACGRRRKMADGYVQAYPPAESASTAEPIAWLIAEERRALVRDALSQMAARDAEILLLKYTEDWSYGQIAEHLGISHSAVEARLHRARKRLRDALLATDGAEDRSAGFYVA